MSRREQVLGTQESRLRAEKAEEEVPVLTSFSACSIPFRKSTLREYSLITSQTGLLDGEMEKKKTCPLPPRSEKGPSKDWSLAAPLQTLPPAPRGLYPPI